MKVKAIVYKAPGQVGVETMELPSCGDEEILCETIYSFVSPGTELRNLSTHNDKFPCVPGYSWVGRVVQVGRNVKGWAEGELVSGRPGHSSLCVPGIAHVYGGHVSHHRCNVTGNCAPARLPEGANPWDYITAEVAAISWHGVSVAFPSPGESAVVVGQGMIGAFAAKWLIMLGARVIVTDIEESRLARARRWGAAAVSGRAPDARERILSHLESGADISVEASSTMVGSRIAASLVKRTLESVVERSYSVPSLRANAFKWPRMVYLATYTDTVQTHPGGLSEVEGVVVLRPGDRKLGDRQAVIEFIRQGHLPVSDFVTEATPVEKAHEAYMNLRDQPGRYSAVAFDWKG